MSRIGKHPVPVPAGVEFSFDEATSTARVKGKLGELTQLLPKELAVTLEDGSIKVAPRKDDIRGRQMWGLGRTLVSNMVVGVSEGFTKRLTITGVGFRANLQGDILNLQLGYSHDIKVAIPSDIEVKIEAAGVVALSGADKQKVGQLAAVIRGFRKPEPYKGKGVRYADEFILRKEGKKK